MPNRAATALWTTGPGRMELRAEVLTPAPGDAVIRTVASGISRGTERLVLEGRVPASVAELMRAPMQEGDFPHPVKYGYANVGVVEDGPVSLKGERVFALAPHCSLFAAAPTTLHRLPADLPDRRATLAANMETALNAIWDGGAAPGDRIAVIGAGVVGCLTAAILSRLPGAEVTLIDHIAARADTAAHFGVTYARPDDAPTGCDIAFHASASAAGAATALDCLGLEGRMVEMSWHGAGLTPLPLGGAFHARRLEIRSSQVGHVAPSRRARWSYGRRLAKALELLAEDPRVDALLGPEIPFAESAASVPEALRADSPGFPPTIRYT